MKVAKFLKQLPDNWTVVWGFFYEDANGLHREGDFLLLAPYGGVLVLEVKGGHLRHFAPTGDWEGGDRDHPLSQLDAEWAAVRKKLRKSGAKRLWYAKALALPDVSAETDAEQVCGIDREKVITGNELADISLFGKALQRIYQQAKPGKQIYPVDDLDRQIFLETYASAAQSDKLEHFTQHTEERFRQQLVAEYSTLDMLEGNQQLLVQGGSGSGKSWYALEKARRYAQEGKKVLFLVYNRAITQVMRADAAKANATLEGEIVVKNFEELCAMILVKKVEEIQLPQGVSMQEGQDYYEETLPAQVIEALGSSLAKALPKYDALVVDEGQDHDTNLRAAVAKRYPHIACGWWSIYWQMLKEETSAPMAIFYDAAQRPVFRANTRFEADKIKASLSQPVSVKLARSVRYTRPIHDFLKSLSGEGSCALVEALCDARALPEGPAVELYAAQQEQKELLIQLGRIIGKWEEDGLCHPSDVLVLHAKSSLEKSALGNAEKLGAYELKPVGAGAGYSQVCSIHKAKGLDAKAVILVGLSSTEHTAMNSYERNTYFMGASRARQLLAVVA